MPKFMRSGEPRNSRSVLFGDDNVLSIMAEQANRRVATGSAGNVHGRHTFILDPKDFGKYGGIQPVHRVEEPTLFEQAPMFADALMRVLDSSFNVNEVG